MGRQRDLITQILGYRGWKVRSWHWESADGRAIVPLRNHVPADAVLVIELERRWAARCSHCLAICSKLHERGKVRRWEELPAIGHRVVLEYAPERVKCKACGSCPTELLAWADPKQRQTRRLQHHLALDALSMPLTHVAVKYRLSWRTVRRSEVAAFERWHSTRPESPLEEVGLDEKWLGRRHKSGHKFVTIASNLRSGEPVWIGYGRSEADVKRFLDTLTAEKKSKIKLFACDMHKPFHAAIRSDEQLAHAAIVHDPFHIMKRAGEAVTELRRQIFFRAGPELRAIGRGTRWLVLRPWERLGEEDQIKLNKLFALNNKLMRAYQVLEELREALKAPDGATMRKALQHILYRTEKKSNVPMRKLHDSLRGHYDGIVALAEHRPPTGRLEALNNNWETLVRRGRGYRDHQYLFRKLQFITANPVRTAQGADRFLALGLAAPTSAAA